MKKGKSNIAELPRNLAAIMFIIIIILTIAQVFFRFALDKPLVWSEELVRFLLVWMTMIGAAVISYDGKHLSINSLVEILPPKVQFYLYTLRQLFIWIFLLISAVSSVEMVKLSHSTVSGALEIPFSYWRIAAPIGCILIFFFSLIRYSINFNLFRKGLYGSDTETEKREVDE